MEYNPFMKRTIPIFLLLIALCAPVFASYSFLDGRLVFDFAPISPLFEESIAYPFSNNLRFSYIMAPKSLDNVVNTILVSADDGEGNAVYKELEFKTAEAKNTKFWQLKGAVDIGLLRLSYKDIAQVEGYIHGGINTIFGAYGGVDCLGFDGQYGGGIAARFFDSLSMRFGIHHFSGHWGDEILADFYASYSSSEYRAITEYTRNNSWYMGLSYDLFGILKLGLEAELPQNKAWIRPAAHVPAETVKPSSEESPEAANTSAHIWSQEGFPGKDNSSYPSSYKAWRIGLSIEAQYRLENIGRVYGGVDFQFHQDGKIDPQTATYDPSRPWAFETSAVIGFALNDDPRLPEFNIELGYHKGRFPLLNYWFRNTEYFSFGVGLTL